MSGKSNNHIKKLEVLIHSNDWAGAALEPPQSVVFNSYADTCYRHAVHDALDRTFPASEIRVSTTDVGDGILLVPTCDPDHDELSCRHAFDQAMAAIEQARHRVEHGDLAFSPSNFRDVDIQGKPAHSPWHAK